MKNISQVSVKHTLPKQRCLWYRATVKSTFTFKMVQNEFVLYYDF